MDIKKNSYLWQYLSKPQQDLIKEGEYLCNEVMSDGKYNFNDYSFMVFPFAKAYEGFLKQLLLDVGFISRLDYISDHFRLGKVLSVNLVSKLGDRSVYKKIVDHSGKDLADQIWDTWKNCRNQVFHYFPHNLRSLSFNDAAIIIDQILTTMADALSQLKTDKLKKRLNQYAK